MNTNRIAKLERPERIAELNPRETLIKAGLKENMVLCDLGAGTGTFAFPAAEISKNTVYALDISDEMIELLEYRKAERNTKNLEVRKVDSAALPINNGICDMVIMVTVLHEVEDRKSIFLEIKRVLKKNGKLMIIEFHKKETPMGPPVELRISEEYVEEICSNKGFKAIDKFSLGENFYGAVFEMI